MDIIGGLLLYFGLISAALGAVSLVRPLRLMGIRTRKLGLMVLIGGILAFTAGVHVPISETRVTEIRTHLDEFAPVYQFSEVHSTTVSAGRDRVYAAIHEVRPEEIRFLKTLMLIRFMKPPAERRPILESFTSGWFVPLAGEPGVEVIFGRASHDHKTLPPDQFRAPLQAPFLKIVMNFRISELDSSHCLLTTETRVYAVGKHMLRGFAAYWRMIQPGSALIRRMWLRAIKIRAEASNAV